MLRFWFDRGVAGVRIDSAALLIKDPELRRGAPDAGPGEHPFIDRDELHDVYRRWRAIADGYDEPRVLVGEIWLPDADRLARYLRPDELHTAFNFDFLALPVGAAAAARVDRRRRSPRTRRSTRPRRGCSRTTTSRGRSRATDGRTRSFAFETKRAGTPTDLERGTRRARAAALLAMALPGSIYVYQGEELGLPEVEDIPSDRRRDPMWHRSGGVDPGRDGCRVPMPWSGDRAAVRLQPRRRRAAVARPARRLGAADRRGAGRTTRPRCSRSTAHGLRLRRASAVGRRRRPCAGLPSADARARVRAGRALRLRRQLRPGAVAAAGRRRAS